MFALWGVSANDFRCLASPPHDSQQDQTAAAGLSLQEHLSSGALRGRHVPGWWWWGGWGGGSTAHCHVRTVYEGVLCFEVVS